MFCIITLFSDCLVNLCVFRMPMIFKKEVQLRSFCLRGQQTLYDKNFKSYCNYLKGVCDNPTGFVNPNFCQRSGWNFHTDGLPVENYTRQASDRAGILCIGTVLPFSRSVNSPVAQSIPGQPALSLRKSCVKGKCFCQKPKWYKHTNIVHRMCVSQ